MKSCKLTIAAASMSTLFAASTALGQTSSLLGTTGQRQPLTLENASWSYLKVEPPQEIRVQDVITVIVDEKQQAFSRGELDQRQRSNMDARLQDWIQFQNFSMGPAQQADGDPRIRGILDSQFRTQSELKSRDSMQFRIACNVVEILPNGNIVLEGHRQVQNNDEVWEQSLSGIVRPQDVLPNNTVLSEDIAGLRVWKREEGEVRDYYKHGFILRWMDKHKPF